MVAPNAIRYDELDKDWYCSPCERYFVSKQAILSHCRNAVVHLDEWCERCEWLFGSPAAMTSHQQNSSRHNVCPKCEVDFPSSAGLDDHLEDRHFYCKRCESYVKDYRAHKSQALWRWHQVQAHFMCTKCDTYFENQNNLDQHQKVHLPRNRECYGCYRKFPSLSGMMIHLESGACSSQVIVGNINSWASQHPSSNFYVNSHALTRYECPECEHRFRFLSGLLQHLESNACAGTIEESLDGLPSYLEDKVLCHASSPN